MHTMQEANFEPRRELNGYSDGRDTSTAPDTSLRDLMTSVVGMVLPMFLQIGHAH